MKPYLYILAVLLVGAGMGFFVGQKVVRVGSSQQMTSERSDDDTQLVQELLERQIEAYRLHDALLIFRDCANSYVEIDGNTGQSMGLEKSLVSYHEQFRSGSAINFSLRDPKITVSRNFAMVKSSYLKTSDSYEKEGFRGLVGEGVWLLSRENGKWQITAFSRIENPKQ